MDACQELKEILRNMSYEKRKVTLASGRVSDFYIDVRQTALNQKGMYLLGRCIFEKIKATGTASNIQAVSGMSVGADPLVCSTVLYAREIGEKINGLFVRKEAKKHGTGNLIEGMKNAGRGDKVIVLEDVVTTGSSTLQACKTLEEAGFTIVMIIAVVDRNEGGRENIEKSGYKISALFQKEDFIY